MLQQPKQSNHVKHEHNLVWHDLSINGRLERLRPIATFTNENLAENEVQADDKVNLKH
ncbi:unnamed protein product [Cunninghamella blakesleeana]